MANESGDTKTKTSASPSASSSTTDSYIGSIISLTSKYEIRYEGILYSLNPQDSTLALKNVRSYGTEGRKKDGPEIPPSDKVYEYILFRGSDIKDLQVTSSPRSQAKEPMHNDPAILQSQCASGPSSLSKSFAVSCGSLTESSLCMEDSTNLRSYPNIVPSHQYGAQAGASDPPRTTHNTNVSSHVMPNPWKGYNVAANDYAYARQRSIPSSTTSLSTLPNFQEISPVQSPTNIALTSSSNSPAPMPSLASNSVYSSIIPTLTSEQLSTYPTNLPSLSMKSSLSSYPVAVANQLNMLSLHSSVQNGTTIEPPEINNTFADPMSLQAAQSFSYSASSLVDSASGSLLKQSAMLLTADQLPQPKLSEISSAQNVYPDHKDMGVINSASSNSLHSSTTPAAQAPLFPMQPSAQQYTEEFDFEAMNEKFKKDEVWGYLGKAMQRDKMDRIEDNSTVCQMLGKEDGDGLVPEGDSKPAYNKDEFFDTISCNSNAQRVRNGQNRFPDRMRHDTEAFGNFQPRIYPGYGGYAAGHGHHGDPYSWGRGYNSGGRGRGGYPRWY